LPWDGNVKIGGYEKINSLDTSEGRLLLSMTIIGEIAVISIFIFIFIYRSNPIMKGSSIFFMSVILVGLAVGFASHLLFIGQLVSPWKCHFQIWLQVIPIPLIMFPLLLKELRCYVLLNRRSLVSRVNQYMTDSVLALPLLVAIGCEVVCIYSSFSCY
jgi:hypothetical protein